MDKEPYTKSPDQLFEEFDSGARGITKEEANRRLREFGSNELTKEEGVSWVSLFINQFKSVLIIILIIAALISGFILNETLDMYVILIIVIFNAIIGFVQEYRAEQAVEALKEMISHAAIVIRGGREEKIPAKELVPGDLIIVEGGDRIPADARVIEVASLKANEAPLTGESTPVDKRTESLPENTPVSDRENMVFMGTHATFGRGKALVVATGMGTEFGKIAGMIQEMPEEAPPLKKKTEDLGKRLGLLALLGCIGVFIIDYLSGISFVQSFLTAVSLAVSAIPEGLPAVLIITLSLGAQRMSRQNAIIRRLASVETLGTTTVICSDKTGTITKNEMTVKKLYLNDRYVDVTGEGYRPDGDFMMDGKVVRPEENEDLQRLLRIAYLCNNAKLEEDEDIGYYLIGDPTEGALVVAAIKGGIKPEVITQEYPRIWEAPFDSKLKRMATIQEKPSEDLVGYVKGAPEVILERCNRIHMEGNVREITEEDRDKITQSTVDMGEEALRVLAVAYKDIPKDKEEFDRDEIEDDLIFVGLLGMIDPPRPEVLGAIKICKKAGIRPVMITGDHKITAVAIAKEVGIMDESNDEALTGQDIEKMREVDLLKSVNQVSVYARVSPEHKVRIARALKSHGNIVAMTGDGVNDAPAIKSADIGIAMGISGTDVTKEASDMVLADDNFATIVSAVEGGRVIYDNIRKFMRYLVSSNFDELIVISSFVIAGLPLPFLPVMILWLNLVTDGGPAIALSMDVPTEDLMAKQPRDPGEAILSGMWLFIGAYVVLQSGTTSAIYLWKYVFQGVSVEMARTAAFMQACVFELIVVFNCRSEKYNAFKAGFTTNKFLLISVIFGLILTISLCYIPFFQQLFHTAPLPPEDWLVIFGLSSLGFLVLPEIFFRNNG
jgi:Ca2+-transporting ATPase